MKRSRADCKTYMRSCADSAGRVTSYGTIISILRKGAARVVGYAMNNSFKEGDVPAHRRVLMAAQASIILILLPSGAPLAEGIVVIDDRFRILRGCLGSDGELGNNGGEESSRVVLISKRPTRLQ